MFWHNFKYSLKTLLKNKMLLFWTFAFPIILGTFFNLAFSNIEKSEELDIIDIAIIKNDDFEQNKIYKEAFEFLSDETQENRLFNIKYSSLDEAKTLLENEDITGYLIFENDEVNITVNSNGINETILRYAVDEICSNKEMLNNLTEKEIENEYKAGNLNVDYEKIYTEIIELINADTVNLNNISNKNLSYTMIEYYTLIAMACLYGGTISMVVTNYKLANMGAVGKRTAISPIHKGKMLLRKFDGKLCCTINWNCNIICIYNFCYKC